MAILKMTYTIATGDNEGRATDWFARFIAYSGFVDLKEAFVAHSAHVTAESVDKFFNVGDSITFETEEYAAEFILKWS